MERYGYLPATKTFTPLDEEGSVVAEPLEKAVDGYDIYNHKASCVLPIAHAGTRDTAELICRSLNGRG